MSKLDSNQINLAHQILTNERAAFVKKPLKGKDRERLARLEDAIRNVEILQIMLVVLAFAMLAACTGADDAVDSPDAGVELADASPVDGDAIPAPDTCQPAGAYSVTLTPTVGTCGYTLPDFLTFELDTDGYVVAHPAGTGVTNSDVDGKCATDAWKASNDAANCIVLVHAELGEPYQLDDGTWQVGGMALTVRTCDGVAVSCDQAYLATGTVVR